MSTPKYDHEQHPLALKFAPGGMPEAEYDALCDDIEARGQIVPIKLYEGKVLSGWHRYRACMRKGITPIFDTYTGDDAVGQVIALELLRRKLGSTQRAVAAAWLVLDFGLSQDRASQRVGISKVHTNVVLQALNSKNARIIKRLEDPNLTREQLIEDLVDSGIMKASVTGQSSASVAQPAPKGGDAFKQFARSQGVEVDGDEGSEFDEHDDLLGGEPSGSQFAEDSSVDLEGLLGAAPSANGKVIEFGKKAPAGDAGIAGVRNGHAERRPKETASSMLAERFRGLTEADQITFMQMVWPVARKLLKPAGLSVEAPPKVEAAQPVPKGKKAPKGTPADIASAAVAKAAAASA